MSNSFWPMDCSMQGSPVIHYLPEFAQTHPLSQWCNPIISSSVTPFSSCSQSFPASRYFLQVELTSIFLSIWTLVPFHRQWILVADLGLWSFPSSPSPTTWFLDMRQSMAVKETRLHINRDKYIRINKDNYIYIMLIITYRQTEPFGKPHCFKF